MQDSTNIVTLRMTREEARLVLSFDIEDLRERLRKIRLAVETLHGIDWSVESRHNGAREAAITETLNKVSQIAALRD